MKKEIKRLHEEMAEFRIMEKRLTEHDIKLLDFQIRLIEIVKQLIEKTERKK